MRRRVISMGAMAASLALAGCGGEAAPTVSPSSVAASTGTAAPAPAPATTTDGRRAALYAVIDQVEELRDKGSECAQTDDLACAKELASMARDTSLDVLRGVMPLAKLDLTDLTAAAEKLALNEYVIGCYGAELEAHCQLAVGAINMGADEIVSALYALEDEQL